MRVILISSRILNYILIFYFNVWIISSSLLYNFYAWPYYIYIFFLWECFHLNIFALLFADIFFCAIPIICTLKYHILYFFLHIVFLLNGPYGGCKNSLNPCYMSLNCIFFLRQYFIICKHICNLSIILIVIFFNSG